jgi:hypothetical protein
MLMILLAPILLPFMTYLTVRCVLEARQLRKVGLLYRELAFEPVNFFHLEPEHRSGFEHWTGEYFEQGFDLIGDFQNKFDPVPVHNRYLIGCGGVVIGDVTAIFDEAVPGLMSVLEDGTYVETSGAEPYEIPGELHDDDKLCVVMAGACPLAELLDVHLQAVEREADRRKTRVLAFQQDQFREIAIFAQLRFYRWRERCGEGKDVPEAVVPDGDPVNHREIRGRVSSLCEVGTEAE